MHKGDRFFEDVAKGLVIQPVLQEFRLANVVDDPIV
jgi:hypothetical protein